jgi:hypothetical protein
MPYTPPTGWLERLDDPAEEESSIRYRFHRRANCSLIHGTAPLVSVDRPGSAARCPACARA